MTIDGVVNTFVHEAIQEGLIHPLDQIYVENRLLALLGKKDFDPESPLVEDTSWLDLLDQLGAYAVQEKLIDDSQSDRDIFQAGVMDLVTPLPSQVNQKFWDDYQDQPQKATDYFYDLSQKNNYIKSREIAKNVAFKGGTPYGDLDITINLSKPEKDPKEIARAKSLPQVGYPKCALCLENEGYRGHLNHAARQNHRVVRMKLSNGVYGFQYSPYAYYNEHAIFLSTQHRPMKIDRVCLENILELVDLLPHYFVGSNADLPGVGGSILTHDHYQGGRYTFPMDRAKVLADFAYRPYPSVTGQILYWPLSVIRLIGQDRQELLAAGDQILQDWRAYSDPKAGILAETDQVHNTVTPIARKQGDRYELNLVLRNNRTSEDFPLGIFHPHPDVHHIKKENIGLIEVMGLGILPPRLIKEIGQVEAYIAGQIDLDQVTDIHQAWAKALKADYNQGLSIKAYVQAGIVQKFQRVLEDAGVFKQDEAGQAAFQDFINHINR